MNAYDVLSRATLMGERDNVRAALGQDYLRGTATVAPMLDGIKGMLAGRPGPELEPLDIVRAAITRMVEKKRDDADIAVVMAGGLDWIEAQEQQRAPAPSERSCAPDRRPGDHVFRDTKSCVYCGWTPDP